MKCNLPVVLTIAGSDGSSGAGIQADLKTFSALGVYGLTVITAITIQNTTGVKYVYPVSLNSLKEQLDILFEDFDIKFLKIGMLAKNDIASFVKDYLTEKQSQYILDTILKASDGSTLFNGSLIPLIENAYLITPNIYEASKICEIEIKNVNDMRNAAILLHKMGAKNVLIKGGHLKHKEAIDILYDGKAFKEFISEKIKTPNTHGTGCTLSSAITAYLAKGFPLKIAVRKAKEFLTNSMLKGKKYNLGKGRGPLIHFEIKE